MNTIEQNHKAAQSINPINPSANQADQKQQTPAESPTSSPQKQQTPAASPTPSSQEQKLFSELTTGFSANPHKVEDDLIPILYSDSTAFGSAYAFTTQRRILADAQLEYRLNEFADTPVAELLEGKQSEQVLLEAMDIYREYDRQLSFCENAMAGLATRYRIQEGRFLKRLQELVQESIGKRSWVRWIEKNLPHKTYRVIRQYIQLAETPNVEHYASLGKEMLVKLIAELNKSKQIFGTDPIGRFLKAHGINYDPERDQGPEHLEMMQQVRVAINYQKILDAKLDMEIARDQVKRLVQQGANVTQALIHELNTAKEEGKDPSNHMEVILEDNGRLQGLKSPADKRDAVLKAFRSFAELTGRVSSDPEYLEALNNEQIEELMNKLEMLQGKINPDEDPDPDQEQAGQIAMDIAR